MVNHGKLYIAKVPIGSDIRMQTILNNEFLVLSLFVMLDKTQHRKYLRFKDIKEKSHIKKGVLHSVLKRLVKKHLVEENVLASINGEPYLGLDPNLISKTKFIPNKELMASLINVVASQPDETKKAKLRALMRRYSPKKIKFYLLVDFPFYFEGSTEQVPKGTRRFWKTSAKALKIWDKDYKFPVETSDPFCPNCKTRQMKSIQYNRLLCGFCSGIFENSDALVYPN